jgi:LysM repeat protein
MPRLPRVILVLHPDGSCTSALDDHYDALSTSSAGEDTEQEQDQDDDDAYAMGSDASDGDEIEMVPHTVQRTDTLAGIALRYGVTPCDIQRANNLIGQFIQHRESLLVPRPKRVRRLQASRNRAARRSGRLRTRLPEEEDPAVVARRRMDTLVSRLSECLKIPREEARFYMEEADGDFRVASQMCLADREWDRLHAHATHTGNSNSSSSSSRGGSGSGGYDHSGASSASASNIAVRSNHERPSMQWFRRRRAGDSTVTR